MDLLFINRSEKVRKKSKKYISPFSLKRYSNKWSSYIKSLTDYLLEKSLITILKNISKFLTKNNLNITHANWNCTRIKKKKNSISWQNIGINIITGKKMNKNQLTTTYIWNIFSYFPVKPLFNRKFKKILVKIKIKFNIKQGKTGTYMNPGKPNKE